VVRGEGEARSLPDRATIRLTVEGEAESRDEAFARAARDASAVDAVLARFSSATVRNSTAALIVQPRSRWKKGEAVRTGWQAARTSVVDVGALDQLADFIAELAAAGAAAVGPYWQLDLSNHAFGEARQCLPGGPAG
jgi:uncharacterized protein YggE